MYSREEVKTLVDKIINMAKADAVEVDVSGGERSGTRWANSSITTNLVQYDRSVTVNVRFGQKSGNATTRDFSDAGLKEMVDEATASARAANDSPNLPELLGPQEYIPVDAAMPAMVNFGPGERARMVRESIDICDRVGGVDGSGYIPKNDQTTCTANSKGLFAYYRAAEAGFILTCRMKDGSGSGWAGITGIKDLSQIDAKALTEVAAQKAKKSVKPKRLEPGRYTVILEPRANARFLSLMTGVFGGGGGGGFPGGGPGGAPGGGAPPDLTGAAGAAGAAAQGGGRGGGGRGGGGQGGGGGRGGRGGGPNLVIGEKAFSDKFSLRSDIGNQILRQTPILGDNRPAKPVQWVENGVVKTLGANAGANVNMSLLMQGSDLSIADMIKQTRRGLLVTFFWYIRGVPADGQPLLNTGMTRDGLFLIENGEIVGPVQNFRWNMSPLVGYNNLTLVGKPVAIHTGESYDGGGTALVPPVRIEDFYMTSVSPAI